MNRREREPSSYFLLPHVSPPLLCSPKEDVESGEEIIPAVCPLRVLTHRTKRKRGRGGGTNNGIRREENGGGGGTFLGLSGLKKPVTC